jgi:hypothetical protein
MVRLIYIKYSTDLSSERPSNHQWLFDVQTIPECPLQTGYIDINQGSLDDWEMRGKELVPSHAAALSSTSIVRVLSAVQTLPARPSTHRGRIIVRVK